MDEAISNANKTLVVATDKQHYKDYISMSNSLNESNSFHIDNVNDLVPYAQRNEKFKVLYLKDCSQRKDWLAIKERLKILRETNKIMEEENE